MCPDGFDRKLHVSAEQQNQMKNVCIYRDIIYFVLCPNRTLKITKKAIVLIKTLNATTIIHPPVPRGTVWDLLCCRQEGSAQSHQICSSITQQQPLFNGGHLRKLVPEETNLNDPSHPTRSNFFLIMWHLSSPKGVWLGFSVKSR